MVVIICLIALLASLLTFFSGFGLGTILTPVFAVFFPVEIAISLTAVVHLLNNVFKMALVGFTKEWGIILRFGIPSMIASFFGAWVLKNLSDTQTICQYHLGTLTVTTTPIKICIALLIVIFTLFEVIPRLQKIQFDKSHLSLGGFISGFFGGLSGNQGALRSMFLIRAGLNKESFIATGIFIACMVDMARLPVYSSKYFNASVWENKWLIVSATLSAFAGAYLGSHFLEKVTFRFLQYAVTTMLLLLALLLGSGII
ncbi:MAG: sulfite exporter TauE/SafE family protein [Bacteroidia bacterium]|nr:sulfite exporter TauE/SafE family protein [Bacteroidia bacterium]